MLHSPRGRCSRRLVTDSVGCSVRKSFAPLFMLEMLGKNFEILMTSRPHHTHFSRAAIALALLMAGSAEAQLCGAGTYEASPQNCVECAAGQYDHDTNATSPCEACPSGTFAALPAAAACVSCPSGKFQPTTAAVGRPPRAHFYITIVPLRATPFSAISLDQPTAPRILTKN